METLPIQPEFLRGPSNPEDLARCLGTDWIVTSGHSAFMPDPQGHIYVVNVRTREWRDLLPSSVTFALDRERFGDVDPPEIGIFDAHGLGLRHNPDGVHTLYVVNHGGRESVEIFDLDCRGAVPALTWTGAVIMPGWCSANDVAPHPDGDFFVTNLCTNIADNVAVLASGEPSGNVLWWQGKDKPLTVVPGSEVSGPNGVEVSADGEWYFINSWPVSKVLKLSLKKPVQEKYEVYLGSMPDNLTWTDDRRYLVTIGQTSTAYEVFTTYAKGATRIGIGFNVFRIDPETMTAQTLASYDNPEEFGLASAALIVGDDVWVGTARNDGLAIFPAAARQVG